MTDDDEAEDATDEREPARNAKDEIVEAIAHFKNAASILLDRATKDPTIRSATTEAERLAKKLGSAAEPLARQLTDEVSRFTTDVWSVVEGRAVRRSRRAPPPPAPAAAERPPKERDDAEPTSRADDDPDDQSPK